jgi:hypothetical protein
MTETIYAHLILEEVAGIRYSRFRRDRTLLRGMEICFIIMNLGILKFMGLWQNINNDDITFTLIRIGCYTKSKARNDTTSLGIMVILVAMFNVHDGTYNFFKSLELMRFLRFLFKKS